MSGLTSNAEQTVEGASEPQRNGAAADSKNADPGALGETQVSTVASPGPNQQDLPPHQADGEARPSAFERAEALAGRIGSGAAALSSVVARGLIRFAARARESLQDFWAEVQSVRRGQKQ
jgi:hypothetical protein